MSARTIADLADLAERLDEVRAARIARGDAHADTGLEQIFADVAANEAAAAEDGNQLWGEIGHGRRDSPPVPEIDKAGAAPLIAAACQKR